METSPILADITPDHNPVALARQMERDAVGCVAGFYVLRDEEGMLTYDGSGVSAENLLWALEKMKLKILSGGSL